MAKRSLTGIKPTGSPHLGNYLGMHRPALAMQGESECFYFIASYHALTTMHDREALRQATLEVAATWLACGLDPDKALLFRQHDIPEVTELAWIFSCLVGMGTLQKAHAFKDAVAKGREVNAGLFTYPLLMAADILIFDSDVVPVGKDQKQHVEMARDIAQRFNHLFGDTLKLPEPVIKPEVAVIPGLDGRKMSKSYGNTIPIFLPPKKRRKLIMSMVTDSKGVEEKKDPEGDNIYQLYTHFSTREEQADLAARYRRGGLGYGHAKQELFDKIEEELAGPYERYQDLIAHPGKVEEVLDQSAEQARAVARATTDRIRDRIGL